jgi:tetratricopeptide (TPR) repeat protein
MRRLLGVLTVVLLAAVAVQSAAASDDAAEKSLSVGINAYRQGSLEASIEAFTEALQGHLSSRQAAKAFYYRGLGYRALGKPGQAISDFDAAIAQPNGLSFSQLADAQDSRTAAQKEAGITAQESVVSAKAETGSPIPVSLPPPQQVQPQPQSFLTTTSIDPAEAQAADPTSAPTPAWGAASVIPRHSEAAASPIATQVLHDTDQRSPVPAAAQLTHAHHATVLPPHSEGSASPFATQVLAAVAPQPAAAPQPAVTVVPQSAAAAGIRVQVARVQTQNEAYALVVRLISQHGAEFDPSMLKIERGVAPDGKTVAYLVRLGPFADADQAQKRCFSLRRTGYDCVVQY